ncbi:hypothetical protein ACHAW5_007024 [Stephanodiscus triporus]|uniref:PCIF1 WW domain-containing protein n=1 Tax=Stephanodiscus triporus TaxID=2934178 RepID=A0ABD3NRG6_9STRA
MVVDGADVDADLVTEVRRASLVRSLRGTLSASCRAAGFVAPTYTWERWQSRCKLRELLSPPSSSSSVAASDEVLPCDARVDDGCVADLVRGGCEPAEAAAIVAALGRAAADAARELADFSASLLSLPPSTPTPGLAGGGGGSGSDGTGEKGCDTDESGEGLSNRRRKRIKLRRRRAMRTAAAAATRDGVDGLAGGGGRKRQRTSLLEQEVALHTVQVRSHRHSVDFSLRSGGKRLFKLNHGHYEKLRMLMAASCGGGGGDGGVSESDFHKLVYCVLSRYHSVLGHGFQMALGEQAFDVLRAWFDVRFECFASPLNCTCSSYASAFPLTDRCFGAVGNFFSLRPSSGSFEANPPFIAEVMSAMVAHIHMLLRDATGPMSFVVIVPGWLDDPSWAALSASSFKCAFFLVAAADHGFCDGAQHQRQDRYRESTYDTGVFVLQNRQGKMKWPVIRTAESAAAALALGKGTHCNSSVSSAVCSDSGIAMASRDSSASDMSVEVPLRRAMARAIPTEMMRLRRLRDGRGHGDLDGGGGVYRGKKANKSSGKKRSIDDDD